MQFVRVRVTLVVSWSTFDYTFVLFFLLSGITLPSFVHVGSGAMYRCDLFSLCEDYFGKGLESVSVKCSIGGTSPVSLTLTFYC